MIYIYVFLIMFKSFIIQRVMRFADISRIYNLKIRSRNSLLTKHPNEIDQSANNKEHSDQEKTVLTLS